MSCHNIGEGLNSVAEVVLKLFDEGKISKDVFKELIFSCRSGVHWCDGNEPEAVECIRNNRCACCLKKLQPGEPLYSIWDISFETDRNYKIYELEDKEEDGCLVADRLCTNCFDKILAEKSGDNTLGAKERKYIEENARANTDRWQAL